MSTRTLTTRQVITRGGTWGYDAILPDGKSLYLIQILPSDDGAIRYLVRAYDFGSRQLVKGAIADKSEPGAMAGYPVRRATTADGTWAHTLYRFMASTI